MTSGAQEPDILIRVGGPQKFDPETRETLQALSDELSEFGFNVKIPIRRTASGTWATLATIGIYLGEHLLDAGIGAAVGSITTGATIWLQKRFKKEKDSGVEPEATYITLYGPDNKPLKHILAKNEDDIRIADPPNRDDD